VLRVFYEAASDAGVGHLSTHTMRHYAPVMVGRGWNFRSRTAKADASRGYLDHHEHSRDVVTDAEQQAGSKVAGLALSGKVIAN
jgi:hypothetical protein